jgi:DNA-binding transcriptional regulator YhcF (GntR family)
VLKITVNRKLAIPLRQQIRGAIEHAISFGGLAAGAPLPSVRELADQAGVAPMTVSSIYADLKAENLIEGRSGSGTFVANSPLAALGGTQAAENLRTQIDQLIDQLTELGLRPTDLAAMINARVVYRLNGALRQRITMIGLFDDATASYAERVAAQVGIAALVEPVTLDHIKADPAALDRVRNADLVLTFSTLQPDVEALTGRNDIISLRFIPSEATRMALAAVDPLARMAVVSRFAEFLPILTLGIRRFAAHVQTFSVLNLDDPELGSVVAQADVLVLATGAEEVGRGARPDTQIIEYRHIPDPGDIDRLVVPRLTQAKILAEQNRKEAS